MEHEVAVVELVVAVAVAMLVVKWGLYLQVVHVVVDVLVLVE